MKLGEVTRVDSDHGLPSGYYIHLIIGKLKDFFHIFFIHDLRLLKLILTHTFFIGACNNGNSSFAQQTQVC
jgi:hypothetical protein